MQISFRDNSHTNGLKLGDIFDDQSYLLDHKPPIAAISDTNWDTRNLAGRDSRVGQG